MIGTAVPRRTLGRELKRLREQSGVDVGTASRAIEISPQTLWRMEAGQPGPKLKELYIKILCQIYGASPELTTALAALVADAAKPRWWHSFHHIVPEDTQLLLELEDVADRITTFHPSLIPDMLQTPDYRRVITQIGAPHSTARHLENTAEVQRYRQARFLNAATDLKIRMLLCEAALRHIVGVPEVMDEQFRHLAAVGALPNVSIRIIPQRNVIHPGMLTGPFAVLEFPQHAILRLTEPTTVYIQDYTTSRYLDNENQVNQYCSAVEEIHHRALDEDASIQLLQSISRTCPFELPDRTL